MGAGMSGGGGKADSVIHRTGLEDSLTIHFRFLDSTRMRGFDSTIYDFTRKVPLPWTGVHLGNFGNASRSLLFTPLMQSGWDHGFHAYDNYNFTVAETRFYNTTRPYTELNYLLGSRAEQMINLVHTQNISPTWNIGVQYRLITSPGLFQNLNVNHNNYRVTSWYQSKNKRYQNFFLLVGNKLQSGENGGIKRDQDYLNGTGYEERSNIPTKLGRESVNSRNFFSTSIPTGTFFTNATYLFRQQYDLGQKDSIVTDSTVIPLFYPRLRLEHTISYSTYKYRFKDQGVNDTTYYSGNYGIHISPGDTFFIQDYWKELVNDFSIYQFPDAKNSQQFVKVGASLQMLTGNLDSGRNTPKEQNLFLHGEYRNRTRNKKWDILASGRFYVNGYNAGDYDAMGSLERFLGKSIGYLRVGAQNTSRTPSYLFNQSSSFYLDSADKRTFNKENITHLFATLDQPQHRLRFSGSYYLVTNLSYFSSFFQPAQSSSLFNLLRITGEKQFLLGKRGWNWRTWVILQQRAGDGPVNVPLVTMRNMIGYDGHLGFKNLNIAFGLESRYFTPYKAPNYSPLTGQYFYQDTATVKLRFPEASIYMHFRIKSFNAYVRAENLHTFDAAAGGFTKNNIPTIDYPYPGLQIRVGIFWSFVN
ncbi:putative porin [Paraflavitalea pollutisoli]|uniref:putative porin n=1 Tax=Paraflavitalea pollutisoli TaxID=3034143 RepID=UPI0023EDCD7B|nr:putative porin [Paraflavitalea sp. H1-2-19X]